MKRNNQNKKKNARSRKANTQHPSHKEGAVGRDLRQLASNHSKVMAAKCRKFCAAVSDPKDRSLDQPILDEAHLADIEKLGIVRVRKRFSTSAVLNAPDNDGNIMWIVANPVAISTAESAVEFTQTYTSGAIVPTIVPAQSLTLGGNAGWVSTSISAPWTNFQLDNGDWSVAYVSSEMTVTNTTQALNRGGYFSGLALDYLSSAEYLDGSNIMNAPYMDSHPDCTIASGDGSITVSHVAEVVQSRTARATAAAQSILNAPLMVKWEGPIIGQSFIVEINALYYTWGLQAHPSMDPVRMPGLWSCLRAAVDDDRYNPVVAAPPDKIQDEKKKETNTLVRIAGNLMKEHAGDIVSFGLTALGAIL